jgi:hypothetical protein
MTKCLAARAGKVISAAFPRRSGVCQPDHPGRGQGWRPLARGGSDWSLRPRFVVTRSKEIAAWETYAIEINLRKGGTTHPFLTLQFLTGGLYDAESATFFAPNGRKKFLVASDHLESSSYRGYTADDLFDLVIRHGLHFGQTRQTGVVFHMLRALGSRGRLGLTAVGNSPEEAREIFEHARLILEEEARFDELE